MEAFAGDGGLLPEQVWDADDIPERELFCGRPSGSAMPLVWAHAEHIKLLRSLRDGAVFDMPPQGVERYIKGKTGSPLRTWRFNNKIRTMPGRQDSAHRASGAGRCPLEQRQMADDPGPQDQRERFRRSSGRPAGRRTGAGRHPRLHFFLARCDALGECRLQRRH